MERPNATFCNIKYGILDSFSHVEFLAYDTLGNKSSKTYEYQPDELDNNLIENNHEEWYYPSKMKLMISTETMRSQRVRQIFRYHMPNKHLSPEKSAHLVMSLLFPFRDEKQLLSVYSPLHQNKFQGEGVHDVVNWSKIKFEPYGYLGDQTFSQFK